ncbi:MAG: NAD-dependent epimerase/dehydratase [Gammaproteobacteria bacterium]|nr:NAD-dependent epimerase/dehydratase [Gammaproteobacteria bacterium]
MSAVDSSSGRAERILITGGAGFIGTNVAHRLLREGAHVKVLDSLSRPGSEANVRELLGRYPRQIEFVQADVRDAAAVRGAVQDVEHVYHLAAQVAVTTSLADPRQDFDINAGGTLTVLEAARTCQAPPSVIFASTNKVYGALADLALSPTANRYVWADRTARAAGVSESRALQFQSPYGCSKGAAEQYVLDYAHSFGLRTVVMRMSCIYGPYQNGTEDQGWVAHFVRAVLAGSPVTIYGSGLQVRDLLFVEDLVDAFEHARADIGALSGRAFNMGGGPANAASILEVLEQIERLTGLRCPTRFGPWRTGDQRYYVSDTTAFQDATGWQPRTRVNNGLAVLLQWLGRSAAPPLRSADAPLTAGGEL